MSLQMVHYGGSSDGVMDKGAFVQIGWPILKQILVFFLIAATSENALALKPNSPNFNDRPLVVLLSIDGARHDFPELHQMKSLQELGKQGVRSKGLIPVFPSKTFPNHYSIVTGLRPKSHRLYENSFYDPDFQATYSLSDPFVVQEGRWYGGTPLWVLAEKQGLRTASYFWVGSEADVGGIRPSYFFPYNHQTPNIDRVEQVLQWARLPLETRPGLITLYFSSIDDAAHLEGPDSQSTKDAAKNIDKMIDRLWTGLKAAGRPFVFVVVSDHGMSKINEDNRVFLENVAPTANLEIHGGGSFTILYAKDKAILPKLLLSLKALEPKIKAYRPSELPAAYHLGADKRLGDVVIVAKHPWYLETSKRKQKKQTGSHGWDPSVPDMRGIFFAVGQDVPRGKQISEFENINIYPWIADVLGLKVTEKIDGDRNLLKKLLGQGQVTRIQAAESPVAR